MGQTQIISWVGIGEISLMNPSEQLGLAGSPSFLGMPWYGLDMCSCESQKSFSKAQIKVIMFLC